MAPTTSSLLLSLLPLASAHFSLNFPAARGDDDTNQATFPCGGYSDPGGNRTAVSLTSIPLSMELGHSENLVSVLLAVGNNPGESFNIELWPTISEQGPGEFCWASIPVPANASIEEGTNATVQVITNGHDGSGLYNCADITFTATDPSTPETCTNQTGISAEFLTGDAVTLANMTTGHDDHEGGHSDGDAAEASGTATESAAEPSATGNNAAGLVAGGWTVMGAAVLGAVAFL